jgi:hypothetical protein
MNDSRQTQPERPRRAASDRALATRSFRLAMRQTGTDRDRALSAHFERFASSRRACPLPGL